MRRRRARDGGMSLIEVVVAASLLSVFTAMALAGFSSLQNASSGANERTLNISQARLLMDASTKDLRTATRLTSDTSAFALAADREATFYANVTTGAPMLIHFYLDIKNRLVEEQTPADAASVPPFYTYTTTPKRRLIAEYVVNTTATPVFTYLDQTRAALTATVAACPVTHSTAGAIKCVNATDRISIDGVGITYVVRHTTSLSVNATTLVNQVSLPNLDYNPTG